MHLFFIDESGTPPKPNARKPRPYFVLSGLVMHEDQWHGVASEVRELTARPGYNITGEIKWRFFGQHNNDPENSVAHLDEGKRKKFRELLFEIITKRKSIRLISTCVSVPAAYETPYVNSQTDLYHFAYKTLTERFQYHLQDLSRLVGSKQLGMVIADHRGRQQDEALRREHVRFVGQDSLFVSKYENFIEGLLLTPSHHSVGIQLADMVAGAVGRAFTTTHYGNPDRHFMDLLPPFIQSIANWKN